MPGLYNALALPDVVSVLEDGTGGSVTSAALDIAKYEGVGFVIFHAKHVSGTAPVVDAVLQFSEDDGVADPYAVDANVPAFTQVTDAGTAPAIALRTQALRFNVNGRKRYMKLVATAGGTSPVFGRGAQFVGYRKDHSQA